MPAMPPVARAPEPVAVSAARTAAARQRRRAQELCLLAALPLALVAGVVLGLVISAPIGAVVGVALLVAGALMVWRGSTRWVLHLLKARPLPEGGHPRLENLVEGLCATFGLRQPHLFLVDDPVPNCCTLGTDAPSAVVVVTSGLLATLGLVELEAVMAHELAHLRRGDAVASSVVTTVIGPWAWLTGRDAAPHAVLGAGREAAADELAVATVRYPPGLERALEVIELSPPPTAGSVFASRAFSMVRWLWVDPMVGRRRTSVEGELDATSVRVAMLAER